MALQGTIDGFPVVDVLQLLAGSHKTGRLIIEGDRSTAQLFVVDGSVTGGSVQGLDLNELADVVVELLRYEAGSFLFEPGSTAPDPTEPTDLTGLLAEAEARLATWAALEAVVPTMLHRIALVEEPESDPIELTADEWRLVVAASRHCTVAELAVATDASDLEACTAVAGLVERGLIEVEQPGAALVLADEPVVEVVVVDDATSADDATDDDAVDGELVDDDEAALDGAEVDESSPAYEVVLLDEEVEEEAAFPEHFPIDDLIDADEAEDPWVQLEHAGREDRFAAAQAFDDGGALDGSDAGGADDGVAAFTDGPGAFSSDGFSAPVEPAAAMDGGFAAGSLDGSSFDGASFDGGSFDGGSFDGGASGESFGGFGNLDAFTDPVAGRAAGDGADVAAFTATFVGDGAFTDAPAVATQDAAVLTTADPAADTAADEVLRQMSKLSPKAAEAIAAALGSAADGVDDDPFSTTT